MLQKMKSKCRCSLNTPYQSPYFIVLNGENHKRKKNQRTYDKNRNSHVSYKMGSVPHYENVFLRPNKFTWHSVVFVLIPFYFILFFQVHINFLYTIFFPQPHFKPFWVFTHQFKSDHFIIWLMVKDKLLLSLLFHLLDSVLFFSL